MISYLVAVEGTNFGQTMTDTEDLSTIRGSSLLVSKVVRELHGAAGCSDLEPIALGGASGLWLWKGDNPEILRSSIASHFRGGTAQFFSFVMALKVVDESEPLLQQKAELQQNLRRRQLESTTVPYPESTTSEVCPIDLVRPVGDTEIWVKGTRRKVSKSVCMRRKFGVEEKQQFLGEYLDCAPESLKAFIGDSVGAAPFSLLLPSISEHSAPLQALRHNLRDKIAVIHIDGNGFGDKQANYIEAKTSLIEGIEKQREFDQAMEQMRRSLVTALFSIFECQGGIGKPCADEIILRKNRNEEYSDKAKFRTDKVIRMEMLLWGGDELTFIIPARLGWSAALAFMEAIEKYWKLDDKQFSASIGMVFCHHDAPIARIRDLADNLASSLKDCRGREATHLFPVVLESFDHIGGEVGAFVARRLQGMEKVERQNFFTLTKDETEQLQELATKLHSDPDFSRSRLRALAQAAYDGRNYRKDTTMLQNLESKTGKVLVEAVGIEPSARARNWMLLEEYWDYLIPCPDAAQIAESKDTLEAVAT